MKDIGIQREIDMLGRIVIPKEIRDSRGWATKTRLDIYTHGNLLIMTEGSCTSSGSQLPLKHPLMQEAIEGIVQLSDAKLLLCLDLIQALGD